MLKTIIYLHKYETDYTKFHIYEVMKYNWAKLLLGDMNTWIWPPRVEAWIKADSLAL
jgi:hypothetical protein